MRIATYAAPFSRDGPGLLLRDLQRDDPQITAAVAVIAAAAPDVLVLTDFDFDLDGLALASLATRFGDDFPYRFARMPNSGLATGIDMDGDGRAGDARDAQGYGRFGGDGGLAVLSRFPLLTGELRDFSTLLWIDLPDAQLPRVDGQPFPSVAAQAVQRLSTTGHWIVPVQPPHAGRFDILTHAATPPIFDGPEDRNGLRSRDELRFWGQVLDGRFGAPPVDFIYAGLTNLDPAAGAGHRAAMAAFLADPRLQDPLSGLPTAAWPDSETPPLRVSYVLPSTGWQVRGAGVEWADGSDPNDQTTWGEAAAQGPHRLVWVDVGRPAAAANTH